MAIGFDRLTTEYNPTDVLGDIATKLEAGRIKDVRKNALADISLNKSDSLITAGKKLIDGGDFEGGLKLIEQGKGLRQIEVQALGHEAWKEWANKPQPPAPAPGGALSPRVPASPDPFAGAYGPGGAEGEGGGGTASDKVFGPPPAPGSLPGGVGGGALPAVAPGPRAEAPTEPPEPTRPFKVAGPVPAPEAPYPPAPGLPAWATPGGLAPVPGARTGGPEAPPLPPPIPVPSDRGASAAWEEFQARANRLSKIPGGKFTEGARAAEIALMRAAANRAELDKETKDWWDFNVDRMEQRLPPVSKENFRIREATGKERFLKGQELYDNIMGERRKQAEMLPILDQLEALTKHPQFFTVAPGTEFFSHFKKTVRNAADALSTFGVPISDELRKSIDHATTTTQLQEAYKAISGSSVLARLGSLSRTTDRDVEFINDISPSLKLSKEGNKMVIEFYRDLVKRQIAAADEVHKVRRGFEERGRGFSTYEINDALIRNEKEKPTDVLVGPDGKPTIFGQRMLDEARANTEKAPEGTYERTPLETIEKYTGVPLHSSYKLGQRIGEALPGAVSRIVGGFANIPEAARRIVGGAAPPEPPTAAGEAGVPVVPRGRMPTITGPDGKKYTWGPGGLVPMEGP
jgi:hypothetical protein